MQNSLPLRLWLGVALYAAVGLLGLVVFHDATPSVQRLTDGYGVPYTAIAVSTAVR